MSGSSICKGEQPERSQLIATPEQAAPENFWDRNMEERPEIIEGFIREGEIGVFAGSYGRGKSPTLYDFTVHLINGRDWCGRKVSQRPVVVIDFETPKWVYGRAIKAIAARLNVPVPELPGRELDLYLALDDPKEPTTRELLDAVAELGSEAKLGLIKSALRSKPNAVVFIDPVEMFFTLDTMSKTAIQRLYRDFRNILSEFPHAAIFLTFNLRKRDRKAPWPDLLTKPREWLDEVCGSLDILNRCDVRLGIEKHKEVKDGDVRVINGIVRGREVYPLFIRPVQGADAQLAGFEQVTPDQVDLLSALSGTQKEQWYKLSPRFRFEEGVSAGVPRSSLQGLTKKALQIGALKRGEDGVFTKLV